MTIEAVITDVTRMRTPNVCIAADQRGQAMRLDSPQPNDQWLQSLGELNPGDVVSLSWHLKKGAAAPHTEDGDWDPGSVKKVGRLTEVELADYLVGRAAKSVRAAFGDPWFLGTAGNGAFRPGYGQRSLATVRARQVQVYPHFAGIRVDFADAQDLWTRVPLEDLKARQHQRSCKTCSSRLADLLVAEFEGPEALLRVGLTRPFHTPQYPPACWMQVNHVFLLPSKRQHFV